MRADVGARMFGSKIATMRWLLDVDDALLMMECGMEFCEANWCMRVTSQQDGKKRRKKQAIWCSYTHGINCWCCVKPEEGGGGEEKRQTVKNYW